MIQSYRRRIARALGMETSNQGNLIWCSNEPLAEEMEPELVYQWIDANDNLTIGSLDEATEEKVSLTMNVTVDSGDTGTIGGLL